MLDVINHLAHGFVVTPVISACRDGGLFALLEQDPGLPAEEIARRLTANEGHLRVALKSLRTVGWVTADEVGGLRAGPEAQNPDSWPSAIKALYQADLIRAEPLDDPDAIAVWLTLAADGWPSVPAPTARLLDGPVLLPLLLRLADGGRQALSSLGPTVRNAFEALIVRRGWAEASAADLVMTAAGRYLLARAPSAGTVLSYRPMLAQLDDLLFGDCEAVFRRDDDGHERHLDRALNVSASGFQHEKYFEAAREAAVSLFRDEAFDRQPRFIVDMGCGDGSLLRSLYEAIRDGTPRGARLDDFPLTLVGVDFNARARDEASRTLTGMPHIIVHGDVADPHSLSQTLAQIGAGNPDDVLHIRSFLDHDRPFRDATITEVRTGIASDAVAVAADGQWISPARSYESLVAFLKGWRGILGRHGLIVLEVHALSPEAAAARLDACESLHFDAYHGFSHQYLVEPEIYASAAAEAGLRAVESPVRFPQEYDFTRITLSRFQPSDHIIRRSVPGDFDALVALEERCWVEPSLRTPDSEIRRRIETHPDEQFVLVRDGAIVGACYTQPIAAVDALLHSRWTRLERLRKPAGRTLQLLGLSVDPHHRAGGLGDRLLDFVVDLARCSNGLDTVAGVSRCSDFQATTARSRIRELKAHVERRDATGHRVDSTLRFHEGHGAVILGTITGFRPADVANGGVGVLIAYDATKPLAAPSIVAPIVEASAAIATPLAEQVTEIVRSLRPGLASPIVETQPFMEMGFDSVELLALRERLSSAFGLPLESAFLFRHSHPAALTAELARRLADRASSAPPAPRADTAERIAVVGLACRFPGGDAAGFWKLLEAGIDGVGPPPPSRWWWPRPHGKREEAGYIDDIDAFDARHFRISRTEAELMDPQQRILLELAWELFEDAGKRPTALRGSRTGVWIGACHFDYRDLVSARVATPSGHDATGTFASVLANRLSYFFDLQGPSTTLDTACSSGLVAIHGAIAALQRGDCDLAVAGAVNLIASPRNTHAFAAAGMLSPSGRCHSFDAAADGYARGEGAALLLLKPLSRALADGDQVYGVLLGSAVNHGGQTASLTAPNPDAQARVIIDAWRQADIDPCTIDFIECHGTGTPLGDPIEIAGLAEAFRQLGRPPASACRIGSLKSNIGHLEGAAGLAGVVKLLLALRAGSIPGNLHFAARNPHIGAEGDQFQVLSRTTAWPPRSDHPRRAGVSSFGFGGVSAHLAIEEPPSRPPAESSEPTVVVLSAKTADQLRETADRLSRWLSDQAATEEAAGRLQEIAWTLQTGREAFDHRLAIVAKSLPDLRTALQAFLSGASAGANWWCDHSASGRDIEAPEPQDDLQTLAHRWIRGAQVDWEAAWRGRRPVRISLPTYPFRRERYWLPDTSAKAPLEIGALPAPSAPSTAQVAAPQSQQHVLTPVLTLAAPNLDEPWPSFGERILVMGGSESDRATVRAHYEAAVVAEALPAPGTEAPFDHLIWFAGETAGGGALTAALALVKGLVECGYHARALGLTLITRRGRGADTAENSALHGFFSVVSKEYPAWRLRLLDLSRAWEGRFDALMLRPPAPSGEAWIEQAHAWRRQALVTRSLPDGAAPYRDEAVYAVVGGAGGLGRAWTAHVLSQVHARVIWLGRSPRAGAVATHLAAVDPGGERVDYIQADARSAGALSDAFAAISRRFGRLDGVVNCAVCLRDGGVAGLAEDAFRAAIESKVTVARNLVEALAARELDFLLSFSSAQSFLRSAGQSAYVAGCCYSDAAILAADAALRPRVVNWGYWAGVGIAADPRYDGSMARQGLTPMQPAAAFAALDRFLAAGPHQIVVVEATSMCSLLDDVRRATAPGTGPSPPPQEVAPVRDLGAGPPSPRPSPVSEVRTVVLEHIATILKMPASLVPDDEKLSDLGIDSILATGLINRLSNALGIPLPAHVIFDYDTAAALADHIVDVSGVAQHPPAAMPSERHSAAIPVASAPPTDEPIAVIGLSGRFAGGGALRELWPRLVAGVDLARPVTRWPLPKAMDGRGRCERGALLDAIDTFDARFFNITGPEATYMDPQQRLFLEEAWRALEDAGYAGDRLRGSRCGVFLGCARGDYELLFDANPPPQSFWGAAGSITPARLAYYLDLRGPTLAVDTACSSSLVAVHLACQSLWSGESAVALAGGVFLQATPSFYGFAERASMLSPTGRCCAFDEAADGFVPGEGVGVVVLKPMAQAVADGDNIQALILGSGINQDGSTNGITAPSVEAQADLETAVYARCAISPDSIGLVETHGSGTPLGDPVEFEALCRAFRAQTDRVGFCALGSLKANIGHTGMAAGIAGLLKALMALKHEVIPPNTNLENPNKRMQLEGSPFRFATAAEPWPRTAMPRRAAISSFGFSGTNAHVVVQEAPEPRVTAASGPHLLPLSARSPQQLRQLAADLRDWAFSPTDTCADAAFTLSTGRRHFKHRLALVADSLDEVRESLAAWLEGRPTATVITDWSFASEPAGTTPAYQSRVSSFDAAPNTRTAQLIGLGRSYLGGATVSFDALFEPGVQRRISLPTYPFAAQPYWISSTPPQERSPSPSEPQVGASMARFRALLDRAEAKLPAPGAQAGIGATAALS